MDKEAKYALGSILTCCVMVAFIIVIFYSLVPNLFFIAGISIAMIGGTITTLLFLKKINSKDNVSSKKDTQEDNTTRSI